MLTPRGYQQSGHDQIFSLIDAGQKRICATAPTGSGKSLSLSMDIKEGIRRGWRVSLYTHRSVLIPQLSNMLSQQGIDHGIRASGHEPDLDKRVQISMWQTEAARCMGKRPRWNLHAADLVLIDEAHGYTASTTQQIIEKHTNDGAAVVGYTATPVDLWHIFNELVVITRNSELQQIGAHLPCLEFAPDEPDAKGIRRASNGEFVEGDVEKRIMVPVVFGRVLEHYHKLNPFKMPGILFGPSVDGSKYFCDEFIGANVSAAHIDAKQIYYGRDPKSGSPIVAPSSQKNRSELFDKVRQGDIKMLCNRFVLTEGLDLPELHFCSMACMQGSVKTFLQAVGRLLRAHPSMDHTCLAEGSLITTDRGLVPIEDVQITDKVWDGREFVSHDGPVLMGHKTVISWDGLTATPDHKVLTENGWKTLEEAKNHQESLVRAATCGVPEWVHDDSNPYNSRSQCESRSDGSVQPLRPDHLCKVLQDDSQASKRLFPVHEKVRGSLSGMDLSSRTASMEAVQRPERSTISQVRRERNTVQFRFSVRRSLLDCGEPGAARKSKVATGSHRQQRALRAGQSSMGHKVGAVAESREIHSAQFSIEKVSGTVSPGEIQSSPLGCIVSSRPDSRGDCAEVGSLAMDEQATAVWDILNCGPRNRYVANDVIVGNCLADHGGNLWRHGSVNEDRDWEVGKTSKEIYEERVHRMEQGEAELAGITCPKCSYVRLSGPTCHNCGHTHVRSSRTVIQQDGTLKRLDGCPIKKKRVQLDAVKAWNGMYWPSYKSKNPHSMTFNQLWNRFKTKHPEMHPHISQDMHGRKRLAVVDPSTSQIVNLPLHPPLNDKYLWAQKVRDIPTNQLLK